MKGTLVACAFLSALFVPQPSRAADSARQAALALGAYYKAHHWTLPSGAPDVEDPRCTVNGIWAQCSFGTGDGNAESTAWLHLKSGIWKVAGTGGGVTTAAQMTKWYGIPPAIAKQFYAKLTGH